MLNKRKLLKINLSVKLLLVLVGALCFGNLLPESLQSILYAISLTLKEILLFVMPVVVFSCLFSCLLSFRGSKAVGFILALFAIVCLSNYLSTFFAYGVGSLCLPHLALNLADTIGASTLNNELHPYWNIAFPNLAWFSNVNALILGFALGAFFSFVKSPAAYKFSMHARHFVTIFLEKCFIPVLPFFALGFILKIQYDGILGQIIQSYLPLLGIILGAYLVALTVYLALASGFSVSRFMHYIKNTFPVVLTGFSTMSSVATMPVTLKAAEKNTENADIARVVIPATVNIHLVGVSIAIPLMALSILLSFGYEFPTPLQFSQFAIYFVLSQFAVAAVPGGGILVMLPLLETHFGFTGEMSALITALYILFDPFVTVTNVLGNSALAILASKVFSKIGFAEKAVPENTQL